MDGKEFRSCLTKPLKMKTLILLSGFILFSTITASAQRRDFEFSSSALNEVQSIWVQLPEQFSDTTSYGVLYVLDADGHFGYMTEYVEYLSKSFASVIPEMIVVGIRSKSPVYRYKNFTPHTENQTADRGNADQFLTFLCDELVLEIGKRYRTTPTRVLAGHSLAGLLAIYSILKKPQSFTHVIAASPSLVYSNGVLLREYLPGHENALRTIRFYFSVADQDMKDYQANTEKLNAWLAKSQWKEWKYEVIAGTDHYSTCPAAFYRGLISVFKK